MSFALCPKNAPAMFQRLHDAASRIHDLNLEDGVYPMRRNRCTHLHGRVDCSTFWTLKHLLISSPTLCYPNFVNSWKQMLAKKGYRSSSVTATG